MLDCRLSQQWMRVAKQTSRKVNLGWWLEAARLPILALCLLLALVVLSMRYLTDDPDWKFFYSITLASFILMGVICWWMERKKFETTEQSIVRLESELGLNNALSAAMNGVGSWPDVPKCCRSRIKWQWLRMLLPLLGGLCMLILAVFVPMGARLQDSYSADEPKGFTDLVESIEVLDLNEVVDEEYIEDIEEKMEQLSEANSDDWFSHASLEAIDSLRESHQNNAAKLKQDLRKSERSLQALSQLAKQLTQKDRKRLINEFDQALQSMGGSVMKPNRDLLEKLRGLDPQSLSGMSKEQMDTMRERMREHAERLEHQQKQNGSDIGEGPGEVAEGEGSEFGNGGVQRGPGHPPGVLGKEKDPLATGEMEGIDPKTLEGALPGDLLDTRSTEHDVDKSTSAPQAGGGLKAKSRGGERIWQSELLPDEQKALKKFFK